MPSLSLLGSGSPEPYLILLCDGSSINPTCRAGECGSVALPINPGCAVAKCCLLLFFFLLNLCLQSSESAGAMTALCAPGFHLPQSGSVSPVLLCE